MKPKSLPPVGLNPYLNPISKVLQSVWDAKVSHVDWSSMENCINRILLLHVEKGLHAQHALLLIDEAKAAYTRRGYSMPSLYQENARVAAYEALANIGE